jgi:hypothetical protein
MPFGTPHFYMPGGLLPVSTSPLLNSPTKYLRTLEAAAHLGVAPGTLNNWRSAGIGPAYSRVGGSRVVYELAELDRFVAAGRVTTSGEAA